jgi:glycerol dehydrogenase-like iron-containing ADH family enzyme
MHQPIPGSKGGGASREAAELITSRAALLRSHITDFMANGYFLTADEIANQMRESVLSIRPRVSELVKAGVLIKTAERRKNASGANAHVLRHHQRLEAVPLPKPEPTAKARRSAATPAIHTDQTGLFA